MRIQILPTTQIKNPKRNQPAQTRNPPMTRLGLHSLESAAACMSATAPTVQDRELPGEPPAEPVLTGHGGRFLRSTEIVELILKDRKRLHVLLQTMKGKVDLAS